MTVIFAVLFSLIFLLLSLPFSNNAWFQLGTSQVFGYTMVFFALAIAIVCFSKRQMYKMRYAVEFNFLQLILWDLAEVVTITLMYTVFSVVGNDYGLVQLGHVDKVEIFFSAFVYVLISLGVPYVVSAQYFAINDKNNTIRLMNMSSVVGDIAKEDKRITLYDNSGILKFSSDLSNLYYIESDDNYIQVWYKDSSRELKQYMLRCRLKTVEESFAGSDLVRCHRKYIVNMSKVRVLKAEKDGYYVDLDLDSQNPIPVSKTYEEAVLSRFNSR